MLMNVDMGLINVILLLIVKILKVHMRRVCEQAASSHQRHIFLWIEAIS